MPYWPYPLRDPDLIAAWEPGAATVTAPARGDLDIAPLLRMAVMFDPGHATHRTLVNLVRVDELYREPRNMPAGDITLAVTTE